MPRKTEPRAPKVASVFCVFDPGGRIMPWSCAWYRKDAISEFVHWHNMGSWAEVRKRGYRCIRVTITPAPARGGGGA
jgi:hypothetical protein